MGSACKATDEVDLGVEVKEVEAWLILVFPGIKAADEPICVVKRSASAAKNWNFIVDGVDGGCEKDSQVYGTGEWSIDI